MTCLKWRTSALLLKIGHQQITHGNTPRQEERHEEGTIMRQHKIGIFLVGIAFSLLLFGTQSCLVRQSAHPPGELDVTISDFTDIMTNSTRREPSIPEPVIPPVPPGAPLMPAPFPTNQTNSGQPETGETP